MAEMIIDTWLYGKELADYAGKLSQVSFANPQISLPEGSTMQDLLDVLKLPIEKRGITFINGDLSAMVGLQPDLKHELKDGGQSGLVPSEYHVAFPVSPGGGHDR